MLTVALNIYNQCRKFGWNGGEGEDQVPFDWMMLAECTFSTVPPEPGVPKCQPHPRPVGATVWGFQMMVLFSSISYFSYSKRCTIDPVVALRHNAENCHSSRPSADGPSCYVKRHKSCDWGHKFQVRDEWAGKSEVGCLEEMMDFLPLFFLKRDRIFQIWPAQ